MAQLSEADGLELPYAWNHITNKGRIIKYLQGRSYSDTERVLSAKFWNRLPLIERRRILQHLMAVGSLTPHQAETCGLKVLIQQEESRLHRTGADGRKVLNFYHTPFRVGSLDDVHHSQDAPAKATLMQYQRPNGGFRMLPSLYTHLKLGWRRGSGATINPRDMNLGHLRNSLALMEESTRNLVDRSTLFLGRLHRHFHNVPSVAALIEELTLELQKVEANQVYPVYGTLSQVLRSRLNEPIWDVATINIGDFWDDIPFSL